MNEACTDVLACGTRAIERVVWTQGLAMGEVDDSAMVIGLPPDTRSCQRRVPATRLFPGREAASHLVRPVDARPESCIGSSSRWCIGILDNPIFLTHTRRASARGDPEAGTGSHGCRYRLDPPPSTASMEAPCCNSIPRCRC